MNRQLIALGAVALMIMSVVAGNQARRDDDSIKIIGDNDAAIVPEIPSAGRNDASRVFLEHAGELRSSASTDYQILVDDVEFSRDGMHMWCDSAHFYDLTGSFEAFGSVRMQQGDTLFIYGDTLHYDNITRLATLLAAPGRDVRLINRDVTLTTTEFNYDLGLDLGYYDCGGILNDRQNRLTSLEGEYSPTTKEAVFRENVVLTSLNRDDTLRIFSDNLYYNTMTHVAMLVAESTVLNRDGVILTTNGMYNTETMQAELFDRSTVTYRNGNTLTGDTLFYNRQTGLGEAFGNVEISDTTNHILLYGDYGYALEPTDSAYVTGRAKAIEYSTADSLYLHADTVRVFRHIVERMVLTQLPGDSAVAEVNSVMPDLHSALSDAEMDTDSIPAVTMYEQVGVSDDLTQSVREITSVADSIGALPKIELRTDTAFVSDTVRYIVAAPRVRFFRRDLQGLCDSMTVVSTDSTMYMDRFPVVWSENRQITGDRITVHFNDSTADLAKVLRNAFVTEHIEDEYFNQLAGKEMVALLVDGHLKHLDVSGNVQAIIFPEENDSTINKMLTMESSFMAADFVGKSIEIERMKLWPETNALVSPLYLTKRAQMYLKDFRLYDSFRPLSPDDIFNFSTELLDAMSQASVFSEPNKPWNTSTTTSTPEKGETQSAPTQLLTPIPQTSSTISTTVRQTIVQSLQADTDSKEPVLKDSNSELSGN